MHLTNLSENNIFQKAIDSKPFFIYRSSMSEVFDDWYRPFVISEELFNQGSSLAHFLLLFSYVIDTKHYSDVIMGTIASQITSLTIVYLTVYWDAD